MSFESETTRRNAKSTLNKLLGRVVPGAEEDNKIKEKSIHASAQKVDHNIRRGIRDPEELHKLQEKDRRSRNKEIRKSLEASKKHNKLVKYNIIKKHKQEGKVSEEEAKYLKKLVKKNANLVTRLSDIDDISVKEELDEVRRDILAIANEHASRKSKRRKDKKNNDFKTKIEKGVISYPGLTPGLAPVDLEDESD